MPNASVLEAKKAVVAELTEKLQKAASGVLVDYKGITVAEDTALRNELRKNEVEYAVVKNTLTRFAAQNAGLSELSEQLNGTTAMAVSHADPIAPMRVINKFAKQFNGEKFVIKAGFMDGKVLPLDQVLPMVQHNLGIGFYPEPMAAAALESGSVTPVRLTVPVPERSVSLIEDLARPQSVAMKALKKMLLVPEEPFSR